MKYISRFAALLMALMMVVGNAGAEMPLDGLTQNELDWLYLAASDAEDMYLTGVLGVTEPFSSSDAEAWQNLGYALQWYVIDTNGERIALPGETGTSINITYTMTEQRFVCVATDEQGEELSPVYVVQAQTEDLEDYLNILYNDYEELYYIPEVPIDAYAAAAWQWMQTWNVTLEDGSNLANLVTDYWLDDPYPADLLCNCASEEADFCVNAPDAEHSKTCGWYTGAPVIKLGENEDGSYTLYAIVNAQEVELAVSEMLDGQHHYFRDVRQGEVGLYVAWLYIDEEGNPWLMPLESEREIPAE